LKKPPLLFSPALGFPIGQLLFSNGVNPNCEESMFVQYSVS
jgi:hypothetical protein